MLAYNYYIKEIVINKGTHAIQKAAKFNHRIRTVQKTSVLGR